MNEETKDEEETTSWHYSSDTNSQKFTDCCGIACEIGEHCRSCGKKVKQLL